MVTIFGTQLNCDFQILHGGFRFAGQAIERGHGVNDVVSFRRGFARAVEMLASFVPAAEIHQRDPLRVMFFGGFHRGNRRTRDALFANAHVHLRAVAEFFAGTFQNALEGLLGADELLLLKKLESFFVKPSFAPAWRARRDREARAFFFGDAFNVFFFSSLWLFRDPAEVRIVRRFTGSLQKTSCANIAKSQRRVNVLKLLGKIEP